MYAVECINKLYKDHRYLGLRNNDLPFLVYEGNADYPQAIHRFKSKDTAEAYLIKFLNRSFFDDRKISISERIDIILVNNSNKFQVIKYHIDEGKLIVDEVIPLPQFTRKDW